MAAPRGIERLGFVPYKLIGRERPLFLRGNFAFGSRLDGRVSELAAAVVKIGDVGNLTAALGSSGHLPTLEPGD